jgi:hypothetical protein
MDNVVKDMNFTLITEIQKPDAKKRLSIGQAMEESAAAYNIYKNSLGQIVLDPVKAVPVCEAWLHENRDAMASVKRGLADSSAGRTTDLGKSQIKVVGRLKKTSWQRFVRLQKMAGKLSKGRRRPKGVFRFASHEEAEARALANRS